MTPDMKNSLKGKLAMRKQIAGKSFAEKLQLLEALRDRQRDIIASRPGRSPRQKSQVPSGMPKQVSGD